MFHNVVWSELGSILGVAVFWFANYAFLFYAFWNDLTLMPLVLLLVRPSFLPPVTKSGVHVRYVLALALVYSLELLFLAANTFCFPPFHQDPLVQKCSWEHMQILDTLLGLREVEVQKWHYYFTLINVCLLATLTTLPDKINSALPNVNFALIALGKDTVDSLVVLVTIVALTLAGCSWPSTLHTPYFLTAQLCSVLWAANLWLNKKRFLFILQAIGFYLVLHLAAIPLFHNHYIYNHLYSHPNLTNLIGLRNMRDWTCYELAPSAEIADAANSMIILSLLGMHVALTWCRQRLRAPEPAQVHTEVEHRLLDPQSYQAVKTEYPGNLMKSSAIALVLRAKEEKFKKENSASSTELQDLLFGTVMNSTMMVWSVLFHSWLGFFMLMMANVMWLIPRQSALMKWMVRFVSIYTSARVAITFVVSFTYDYPETVFGFHLKHFGLRYDFQLIQLPLLMQSLFTAICLIVYRQYTMPYIAGLNIPLSGFRKIVKVFSLLWVRFAILVMIIMVLYDVETFKIVIAPFYLSMAIALWMARRPKVPLTVFFSLLVLIAELKLMMTYIYNFKGAPELLHSYLNMDNDNIQRAFGLNQMTGTSLLVHLWLPNILSMFSAIFLTVLRRKTVINLKRNQQIWEESMGRLVLASAERRSMHRKRRSSSIALLARPQQVTFASTDEDDTKMKND